MTENKPKVKQCENCQFYSEGVAVTLESGTQWKWKDCTKQWGKPQFIGVIKNVCQAHKEIK